MTQSKLASTILAAATLAALFMFVPVDSDSADASLFGVETACAQTGTCAASPGDICFVNGVPYDNRAWESGAEEPVQN